MKESQEIVEREREGEREGRRLETVGMGKKKQRRTKTQRIKKTQRRKIFYY